MDVSRTSFLLLLLASGVLSQTNTGLDQEDLEQFLQPDTVGDFQAPEIRQDFPRRCDRPCLRGGKPRLCYYKFTVEDYHTLGPACGQCPSVPSDCFKPQCVTADGIERGLLTVNRKMEGPSIQVCLNDRVIIDLHNVMPGRTTTIHFHGIFQDESNSMDGVPMVTQCPVPEGATFRYDFFANNAGTHFWHSHDGFQKMDGLQGSLIVRQPRTEDPSSKLYDEDLPTHVMLLSDWFEDSSDLKFPGLLRKMPGQEPVSYLLNGRGRYLPPVKRVHEATDMPHVAYGMILQAQSTMNDVFGNMFSTGSSSRPQPLKAANVPLTTYEVIKGKRYRFRLIGGTCAHCPAEVSIQQHRMRVIGTDGNSVKPVIVDRIVVLPGERYDFVLDAKQKASTYWIQVRGLGPCAERSTSGVAVLKYTTSSLKTPESPDPGYMPVSGPKAKILNPIDSKCGPKDKNVCVSQLETLDEYNSRLLDQKPEVKLHFNFNFKLLTEQEAFSPGSYQRFLVPIQGPRANDEFPGLVTAHMNNISNVLGASPLLNQFHDIPPDLFCKGNSSCPSGLCECLHLVKIPLDALVEMVIADESMGGGDLIHPFHLHGHKFHVLELAQFPAEKRNDRAERRSTIEKSSDDALNKLRRGGGYFAGKDTIAVPASGFAVLRFIADNPGFWMVHCHYIYHQIIGMNVVLQVGDLSEIPRPPPGFPTCGNFVNRFNTGPYV